MAYSHEAEHSIRTKIALWGGAASLVLLPLGALGTKFGIWDHNIGLLITALSFAAAIAPTVLFIGFAWHGGYAQERKALLAGFVMALVPLGLAVKVISGDNPVLHDVSTDLENPPTFAAAIALRGSDSNPLDWKPELAEQIKAAYPEVITIHSALSPAAAMAQAQSSARKLGWEIIDASSRSGHIEAVDTTFWFGFKDDVVIRIQEEGEGSKIDLRSVSRVGQGDLGANAARIQAFITAFSQP